MPNIDVSSLIFGDGGCTTTPQAIAAVSGWLAYDSTSVSETALCPPASTLHNGFIHYRSSHDKPERVGGRIFLSLRDVDMQSAEDSVRTELSSSQSPVQCYPEGYTPLQTRLTMGTQLLGSNAAWMLLGLLACQTYIYYISASSSKDHPLFKSLVYGMVILVTAESAMKAYVSFNLLVSGWGDTLVLAKMPFPVRLLQDMQLVVDAIPALLVQMFFTWRIWTFCMAAFRRKTKKCVIGLCVFIVLTSVCAFIAAVVLFVAFLRSWSTRSTKATFIVWAISTAAADVTITICMIAILYHAKSNSYYGETRNRISRLLRLTIQTGFLTCILAIPVSPLFVSELGGAYSLTCFMLGKSYVISLLANLNARSYHPPADLKKIIDGFNIPLLSTIAFTPGPSHASDERSSDSGAGGADTFIRPSTGGPDADELWTEKKG